MDFKEIFRNYGRLVANYGVIEDDGDVRSYLINELMFTFEYSENKWEPMGLAFSLFGSDLILLGNGQVYLKDDLGDDVDFYPLTDEALLHKTKEFLSWRLKTLKDYQF